MASSDNVATAEALRDGKKFVNACEAIVGSIVRNSIKQHQDTTQLFVICCNLCINLIEEFTSLQNLIVEQNIKVLQESYFFENEDGTRTECNNISNFIRWSIDAPMNSTILDKHLPNWNKFEIESIYDFAGLDAKISVSNEAISTAISSRKKKHNEMCSRITHSLLVKFLQFVCKEEFEEILWRMEKIFPSVQRVSSAPLRNKLIEIMNKFNTSISDPALNQADDIKQGGKNTKRLVSDTDTPDAFSKQTGGNRKRTGSGIEASASKFNKRSGSDRSLPDLANADDTMEVTVKPDEDGPVDSASEDGSSDQTMNENTSNGKTHTRRMGLGAQENAFMKNRLDDNNKPVAVLLFFNSNPNNLELISSLGERGYFVIVISDHNYQGDVVIESCVPDSVEPRVKELSTNCGFTIWYRFTEQTKYSMFKGIKNVELVIMDFCNMPSTYMNNLILYAFRLIGYFRINEGLTAEFQAFIPNNGSKLNKKIDPIVRSGFYVKTIGWKSFCKMLYSNKLYKEYKDIKCNGLEHNEEYYVARLLTSADPNDAVKSDCLSYCEDE